MHKVVVDRSHAVVSLVAAGFFAENDLLAAADDLHAGIRSLGEHAGRHVTLYDLTALEALPGPVLDGFARYFTDPAVAPLWARRVALVTRSHLVGRQMQRVRSDFARVGVFRERREGLAWLLAAQERPRTTSHPTAASG